MKPNRLALLLCLFLTVSGTSIAATYYVKTNGNDSADGTSWDTAKLTIQAGVNVAGLNDTVLVTNGTYVLTNQISVSIGITVKSVNGASVTIMNGNYPVTTNRCFYLHNTNAILDGFTITNGNARDGYYNGGGGVMNQGGTVQNCTISGNTVTNGNGGGVYQRSGLVENSIICFNSVDNIYVGLGSISNSCITPLIAGGGNIAEDPQFIDPGSGYGSTYIPGDYRLKPHSPCINTGTNQAWMVNTNDVEGNPRICLGTVDMGAYEYNPCFASDGSSVDYAAISWNSIFLASGYRIYRNASNYFASASSVGSTAETNYNDTTAVAGTTYWYWSQATNSAGVIVVTSPNYGYRAISGAPLHPTNITTSQSAYSNKVNVSWSSSANATAYTVWRANTDDFSQSSCLNGGGTADTNYEDATSTPGAMHYFWVRSLNASGASGFSDPSHIGIRGLTPPTSISATDGTYAWVWITWTESAGATNYEVWRNTQPLSSAATKIGSSSITNFADTTASAGQTYYYWVKPKAAYTTGAFSGNNPGSCQSWPATVSSGTYQDRTRISWNAVEGASGYGVWRNTNSSLASAIMMTNNLAATEYSDYGGTFGVLYYYWAKATNSMTNCYSSSSSGYRGAFPPTGISASKGTYRDKVHILWSASANATGYEIYRSEANDPDSATLAGESATTSFDDTDVEIDTGYYFWIKAKNISGISPFSTYDTGWSSSSAGLPSVPTGLSASDGEYTDKVMITWNTASSATGYRIFRYASNNSTSADQIGTATSTTYDDTGAVAGTTNYYWVKSTNSVGTSEFSSYDTGWRAQPTTAPSAPTGISASDGAYTDKIQVTWNAVSDATSYQVWRSMSNNMAIASNLITIATTTYDDLNAATTPGTILYYWVKAVNAAGASGFSTNDTGYVKPAIGPTIKANGAVGNVTINYPDAMAITIEMNEDPYAGAPVDWWVLSLAGSSCYYLNSSVQWTQYDGNLSNCHPLYQGGSCNLPATLLPALNIPGLPVSSYTFWFAVDAQMDGILNMDQIWVDAVTVNVQ